ncbi:LOW QUALITY PROTEIN: uncharacterized protein LOC108157996 [Drosophila miranda]|uniref:LOW QUALITY PROTEIN: uncharacterized protein LOC108157996 n=1 Tax=Drosophila miranda TaxID=7229 RepID=UPI00143F3638|nr:LOW QUALITY PROTEIN: uncharacterized protein LOC108157996 [Drosophila miranda]
MFYKWLILVAILLITGSEPKHRRLRWDCFDCQTGPQYADHQKCQIADLRHWKELLNVEVKLLEAVPSVRTYMKISTRFKQSEAYRKFLDISFDGCRVISDLSKGTTMMAKIYNAVVKFSNQRKCPIKKGFIYYHNISIEEVLPSFLPASSILVEVHIFRAKKTYLNVTLRGDISEI